MNGAIINCIAQPISGGTSGGPYFAVAFGEFFMTEPMIGPTDSLFMELSNVLEPGTANTRALVQLYR
jgi:hypothetical protein